MPLLASLPVRALILRRAFRWTVALLLAAGCSAASLPGQDGNASSRATGAADRTPVAGSSTAVATPTTTTVRAENEVQLGDHYVDPEVLTVKVGTTVTWRNSSGQHDVTARDGSFRSPTLGDSYAHTFNKPGSYAYFCSFHPSEMRGEVVVEPAN